MCVEECTQESRRKTNGNHQGVLTACEPAQKDEEQPDHKLGITEAISMWPFLCQNVVLEVFYT